MSASSARSFARRIELPALFIFFTPSLLTCLPPAFARTTYRLAVARLFAALARASPSSPISLASNALAAKCPPRASTTTHGRSFLATSARNASSTLAWCVVTDHCMTFTVGVAKSLQAVAYVKREGIFLKWWLANEHRGDHPQERLEFGINLATLLECLRIFGGASVGPGGGGGNNFAIESKAAQLHLNYRASTACLNLCLVEGCARGS